MAEESNVESNAAFSIQHRHCVLHHHLGRDPLLPDAIGTEISALDYPSGCDLSIRLPGFAAGHIA
jgi:hypothetical protein